MTAMKLKGLGQGSGLDDCIGRLAVPEEDPIAAARVLLRGGLECGTDRPVVAAARSTNARVRTRRRRSRFFGQDQGGRGTAHHEKACRRPRGVRQPAAEEILSRV